MSKHSQGIIKIIVFLIFSVLITSKFTPLKHVAYVQPTWNYNYLVQNLALTYKTILF